MRRLLVIAIVAVAAFGVALDIAVPGLRDWLYYRSFTNSVLAGVLLIAATYLVVERALEERDRRRAHRPRAAGTGRHRGRGLRGARAAARPFADVHDFGATPSRSSETWALPTVRPMPSPPAS